MQGIVIAFFNKGFGFVRSHETHEELFFHVADVGNAREGKVDPGDEMGFTRIESSRGPKAVAAIIIKFAREDRREENVPANHTSA